MRLLCSHLAVLLGVSLGLGACDADSDLPSDGETDGSTTGPSTGETIGESTGETLGESTGASGGSSGEPDPTGEDPTEQDTHGFVEVRFQVAASETENPYTGTQQVQILMSYGECYQQFYAANPNWTADGVDGALVFGAQADGGEGWRDRLCTEDVSGRAECEVVEFEQSVDAASRLTVTYDIEGPLEGRALLFGPLPLSDLTACEGGFAPRVSIELGGTRGLDAEGNQVWSVSSANVVEVAPGDSITINASS